MAREIQGIRRECEGKKSDTRRRAGMVMRIIVMEEGCKEATRRETGIGVATSMTDSPASCFIDGRYFLHQQPFRGHSPAAKFHPTGHHWKHATNQTRKHSPSGDKAACLGPDPSGACNHPLTFNSSPSLSTTQTRSDPRSQT